MTIMEKLIKNPEVKADKVFNPEAFKMKFRAAFAVLSFVAAMIIILIAMLNTTAQTSKFTGPIIGFITGSLITLILSYYFGSSEAPDQVPGTIPPNLKQPRLIQPKQLVYTDDKLPAFEPPDPEGDQPK